MRIIGEFSRLVTPAEAGMIDSVMINETGIPSIALMEQASTAVANAARDAKKALVIAGGGNNGGDALACARIMRMRSQQAVVGVTTRSYRGDAAANYAMFADDSTLITEENVEEFFAAHADADVIIDGIFGTGLSRAPEGVYKRVIDAINAHPARVIAIDIPSGVNGETGAALCAVKADETVTFQFAKTGHYLLPGRLFASENVTVAPIGVYDRPAGNAFLVRSARLAPRRLDANKGTYGRLAVIAGQKGMAGAAQLCARGALTAGAGLTQVVSVEAVTEALQQALPEVMTKSLGTCERIEKITPADVSGASALAVGPGLGVAEEMLEYMGGILEMDIPKVLDADAINLIAKDRRLLRRAAQTVITPHPREFARISGMDMDDILAAPLAAARSFAVEYGVDVLLKGATTVVCRHDTGEAALVTAGSPAMAKGGSGDVLTGVIGALMAAGAQPFEAAWAGAYFCGAAGSEAARIKGEHSATATDTIDCLGAVIEGRGSVR